ncbi:hypothetical protein GOL32_18090 [Sinorhizobium medicae]|nr:hypothetical protein [Sinorhizobium medicae]
MADKMTKGEREDLQRLIRQREKVLKSAAKARSTELLADFENQISAEYRFDDDTVWAAAEKAAEAEVRKAQERVTARCEELGIPKQFAPSLNLYWSARGYENSVKRRRDELRKAAEAQVAALEQQAIVKIEQASVEAQTEIAIAGLTSEASLSFAERLPSVESLMPALSYRELAGDAEPPIIEQILTPNALRQRRFRERQKALRNESVTPENTDDHQEEKI